MLQERKQVPLSFHTPSVSEQIGRDRLEENLRRMFLDGSFFFVNKAGSIK